MISANPLHDQRIIDNCFHLLTTPGLRKAGWLFGMVSVYGKTPEDLKDFIWSEKNTIIIKSKKRPVRPLHPEWVSLFQLKEKQPSKTKDCWNKMQNNLNEAIKKGVVKLTIPNLLVAYKMRKLVYAPVNKHLHSTCPTLSAL
tara:strand:- start:287 stop:712 length:426 start_codon:yes stop_codon:yes gene_type:complete